MKLIEVSPEVKNRIMLELFGTVDTSQIKMIDISLPKHAGNTLTKKKLSSLAKKYFSIPDQFLKFYPKVEGVIPKLESQDNKPK